MEVFIMKKIVFSFMMFSVLMISYSFIIGFGDEASALAHPSENLFSNINSLDPIDSERATGLHDPEVADDDDLFKNDDSDDKNQDSKSEDKDTDDDNDDKIDESQEGKDIKQEGQSSQENNISQVATKVENTDVVGLPKLTTKDLQGAVELHEKVAEKYKELAENIQKIWAALQGSQLGKEVNIVELTQLLHNVEHAHKNAGSIFELMLTIQKLGFDLGDKLESELQAKAKDLSVKAQELTEKAAEEMEKNLGLKPALNI